jgi:hypothetical protein
MIDRKVLCAQCDGRGVVIYHSACELVELERTLAPFDSSGLDSKITDEQAVSLAVALTS